MDNDRDRTGHGPVTGRPGAGKGSERRRNPVPLILGAIVAIALLLLLLRACSEASDTDYGITDSPPGETLGSEPDTAGLDAAPAAVAAAPSAYAAGNMGALLAGTDPLPRTYQLAQVTFDSGSAELSDAARSEIEDIAGALRGRSTARVSLRGYADPEGDPQANQRLSQQRAEAVRAALVESGAAANQVQIAALGETGDAAVAQNRRVELTVSAR